ncbi:MAG: hypothetical protein Q4F83_04360 [Eubacteriales bacterium]|nr:hypothetical protein [Eubacteriales bacterium]
MSSKTKILVMKKKDVIYTGIFAAFAIIFIILLFMMFRPSAEKVSGSRKNLYTPGVYTTQITLNNNAMNLEVRVDESHINSIDLVYLSESASAMFPLMQPTLDNLEAQICQSQSTDDIYYEASSQYTSQMLLEAINDALETAASKAS